MFISTLSLSQGRMYLAMFSTFLREKDFSGYYRMIALTRYPCRIMFVSIAEVWRGETKESMIDHFRLDPYLHHLGDRFWRHETPVNHK